MDFEPERDYPLGTKRPDLVTTPGGIPLADVTLEAAGAGGLSGAEMRATPETLRRQAAVAGTAGRRPPRQGVRAVGEGGRVGRRDGRAAADFDIIDRFVAAHYLDLEAAAEAATLTDARIAHMLVDVDVPREELVRLAAGLTPARVPGVVSLLDPVELMFAPKKLRARRRPAAPG